MRILLALALGLGLLSLPGISIHSAKAQAVPYPGSPGSPYTTGSLKRHKPAATHHARKVRVRGHKVKKAQER
jgi:hypothetical protein